MMLRWRVLILVAGCLWIAPAASADDPVHKLGRGLANVATGWIEIPKRVAAGRYEENPWTGIGGGLVKGATLTLLRLGLGVYEVLTFPIPYPDNYASPYEGIEVADYAWE